MRYIKFLKSSYILVFLIITGALFLSIYPTLYHLLHTPAGTEFSLAFNYLPDYYHYISWMKDGQNGHFDITTRYTAEVFPRRFAYILYPILGFVASKIGLNLFYAYFLGRILLGGLAMILIYLLISILIKGKSKRVVSFVITLLSPSFAKIVIVDNHINFKFFLDGITNFDVYRRLTFIPHHTLSHILTIIFFILFYKALREDKKMFSIIAGLSLSLAIILNPATLIYMAGVCLIAFILLGLSVFRKRFKLLFIHFILFTLPLFISIIYYRFYLFTVFPFDILSQSENSIGRTWSIADYSWTVGEYLGALGPALILAVVTILVKKLEKNILYILLLSWVLGPILLYFIFKHFFNSYILIFRLFQAELFVPLGILGSFGFFYIYNKLKKRWVRIGLIGILVIVSLPYYFISFKYQIEEMPTSSYNVYLPEDTISAFKFLDKYTPADSVVLAGYYMAELLPAYTHNRAYLGRPDLTYKYDEKIKLFTKFFSGQMTSTETENFLKDGHIAYILFGPDTPAPSGTLTSGANIVRLIYQSGNNYVYEVN